jgi:hypothetical protein
VWCRGEDGNAAVALFKSGLLLLQVIYEEDKVDESIGFVFIMVMDTKGMRCGGEIEEGEGNQQLEQ